MEKNRFIQNYFHHQSFVVGSWNKLPYKYGFPHIGEIDPTVLQSLDDRSMELSFMEFFHNAFLNHAI